MSLVLDVIFWIAVIGLALDAIWVIHLTTKEGS